MSKFKNIPGLVWLVIGVLVTLLVIPSTAYAAALKFTGIEGTSTNKADVTPAGQLLTTEAQPGNLLGGSSTDVGYISGSTTFASGVLFKAPSTEAVVLDALTLSVRGYATSASGNTYYDVYVGTGTCSGQVGSWLLSITPTGFGTTEVPLTPGVAIPAGDSVCSESQTASGTFFVGVTATGALVPATDVSNAQPHPVPAPNG